MEHDPMAHERRAIQGLDGGRLGGARRGEA